MSENSYKYEMKKIYIPSWRLIKQLYDSYILLRCSWIWVQGVILIKKLILTDGETDAKVL